MFAASLLPRFIHNPTKTHIGTLKRVLMYISGTIDVGIKYENGKSATLIGFCDSNYDGIDVDMRSTLEYAFTLGSCIFCWESMK